MIEVKELTLDSLIKTREVFDENGRLLPPLVCKVISLHQSGCIVRIKDDTTISVEYKSLEPIPITSEILERNGFEESVVNEGNYIWRSKLERVIWNEEENITIRSVKCDTLFQGHCYYIHQLQNALRLCGIRKEIELWNT